MDKFFSGHHQRSSQKAVLFIVLACASLSCTTNTQRAAKITAYAGYYRLSYQQKCHSGPNNSLRCAPCQSIIQKADEQAAVANTNAKLGYMPPQQQVDIDAAIASLETCP